MTTRQLPPIRVGRSEADGGPVVHLIHPHLGEAVCKTTAEQIAEGRVNDVTCERCKGWMVYNGYLTT